MDHTLASDDSAPRGDLLTRLTSIERRLAALEDWREKGAPRQPRTTQPTATPDTSMASPPHPVALPAGLPTLLPEQDPLLTARADTARGDAAQPGHGRQPPAPSTQPLPEDSPSWEQRIAGRWYAYAGALVLVMGVALGLKWAYDVGLLRVAPIYRCLLAAGFGFALLGVGREVAKRINAWAAAASYVAGIGAIYASVYAAFQLYALLTPAAAFFLLGATSALGVGVAIRSRLASVGVVSLLAAYVAPVLLWEHSGPPWALPAYLLVMLLMGSGVAWLRGGTLWLMGSVATLGTVVLGGVWILQHPPGTAPWALAFLSLTWLVVQATTSRHALKGPATLGLANSAATELDAVWNHLTLLSSFAVSIWGATLGALIIRQAEWPAAWSFAATTTIACAALAARFAPISWTRSGSPHVPGRVAWGSIVGRGFWLQAGILLGMTILIALDGRAEAVAWASLGLGATLLARRLRSPALAWYGVASFFMLVQRGLFADSWNEGLFTSPAYLLGLEMTWRGTALLLGACGCCWAIWVRDRLSETTHIFRIVACLAVPVVLVALGRDATHGLSVLFAWILLGSALSLASRKVLELAPAAIATLVFSLGAWTIQFVFREWSERGWPLLLHPGLVSAILLVTAMGPMWRWAKQAPRNSRAAEWMALWGGWAGATLLLVASSLYLSRVAQVFEVRADARAALLSMWWGIFGFVAIGIGFVWHSAGVRRAGLALLAAGAAKAVLIDLADVSTLWRVVSFFALGALLMIVGIGYQRIEKRLIRQGTGQTSQPPPR